MKRDKMIIRIDDGDPLPGHLEQYELFAAWALDTRGNIVPRDTDRIILTLNVDAPTYQALTIALSSSDPWVLSVLSSHSIEFRLDNPKSVGCTTAHFTSTCGHYHEMRVGARSAKLNFSYSSAGKELLEFRESTRKECDSGGT